MIPFLDMSWNDMWAAILVLGAIFSNASAKK